MEEILKTSMIPPNSDDEISLSFSIDDGLECISIEINGKHVGTTDWDGNLQQLFTRALEIWKINR